MRTIFILLLIAFSHFASAQLYIGGFLGGAGYNGDLNEKVLKRIKPAVGATIAYQLSNRFHARFGLLLTGLEGGDKWSGTEFLKQNRNLSFKTDLTELSLLGELHLFNLNKVNWTPYVFGGIALFHFNPYVIDSNKRVYLKPLSTEGQGISNYPDRQFYSLVQFSVPFGGGIKYLLNDNLILGFELNMRRTMTDYLDDVSTTYVDEEILLQQRGATAVRLSYRAGEVPGSTPSYPDNGYPSNGIQRGGAKYKDWYYTAGFHLIFRLNTSTGKPSQYRRSYGCTNVPAM